MSSSQVASSWRWGPAPVSAKLFAVIVLLATLAAPAFVTMLVSLAGGAPLWILFPSVVVLTIISVIWSRIGVSYRDGELIVRNRIRTIRVAETAITGFTVKRLDKWVVPNLPYAIWVRYRSAGGERESPIVATAVREGNTNVREWYASQFTQIGPGLDPLLVMRYSGRTG